VSFDRLAACSCSVQSITQQLARASLPPSPTDGSRSVKQACLLLAHLPARSRHHRAIWASVQASAAVSGGCAHLQLLSRESLPPRQWFARQLDVERLLPATTLPGVPITCNPSEQHRHRQPRGSPAGGAGRGHQSTGGKTCKSYSSANLVQLPGSPSVAWPTSRTTTSDRTQRSQSAGGFVLYWEGLSRPSA
jgi:hypothetical protein